MKGTRTFMRIAGGTDTGRVRGHNEDAVGQDELIGLAVLADGMGGHKAGEVASGIAINTIIQELSGTLRQLKPGQRDETGQYTLDSVLIRHAIEKANRAIHDTASRGTACEGMGTTVVVAAFYNHRVSIAHVGDSRLYRLRHGRLEQLTADHSLADELIAKGCFDTVEEVNAAGFKNAITRALGLETDVRVDLREEDVRANDVYLLCSDGLTDMVDEAEIQRIIESRGADLPKAVHELIDAANRNGGRDNISVILARPMKGAGRGSWWSRLSGWFRKT
ncbi:Stp1/IreP family PP2C-type Ser/Thr phosphatase [Methylomagnum sp.]